MKRLSLQWRLMRMVIALVAVVCLLLNLFISSSAIMHINEIENYMIEVVPNGQDAFVLDAAVLYPALQAQIRNATETFGIQSILTTLAVLLLAGIFTYFLVGRAPAPLRELGGRMEKIQAQNLSEPLEIPHTDDEVAQLTRVFNGMMARLDGAFTEQHWFSANAAHELRTPLAVMLTNLDVLKKRKNPTAEEYTETLQRVSEQTEWLSHLVKMLLEMTELETIPRNDHISLSALMEEVLCDLAQVADEKK